MEQSTAEGAVELGWRHVVSVLANIMDSVEMNTASASVTWGVYGQLAAPKWCQYSSCFDAAGLLDDCAPLELLLLDGILI